MGLFMSHHKDVAGSFMDHSSVLQDPSFGLRGTNGAVLVPNYLFFVNAKEDKPRLSRSQCTSAAAKANYWFSH